MSKKQPPKPKRTWKVEAVKAYLGWAFDQGLPLVRGMIYQKKKEAIEDAEYLAPAGKSPEPVFPVTIIRGRLGIDFTITPLTRSRK